jgi:hypothetical protein
LRNSDIDPAINSLSQIEWTSTRSAIKCNHVWGSFRHFTSAPGLTLGSRRMPFPRESIERQTGPAPEAIPAGQARMLGAFGEAAAQVGEVAVVAGTAARLRRAQPCDNCPGKSTMAFDVARASSQPETGSTSPTRVLVHAIALGGVHLRVAGRGQRRPNRKRRRG